MDTERCVADGWSVEQLLDELHLPGPVQQEDAAIAHRASGSGCNECAQPDPVAAGADDPDLVDRDHGAAGDDEVQIAHASSRATISGAPASMAAPRATRT